MILKNLPKNYIKNIFTAYGELGKLWIENLPTHIDELSKKWDFHFIKPLPDLSYNFVALVELKSTSQPVILKTAPKGANILLEAYWLQHFHYGTPLVFEIDNTLNAFLMEKLDPGHALQSLVTLGQDEEATRILAQTILTLHSDDKLSSIASLPKALSACKHISEWASSLTFLKGKIDERLVLKAESLFRDLSLDSKNDVLLHGDLHHYNILKAGSTWKVIDPHGYIGDPAAESSAMIYNPMDHYPKEKSLDKILDARVKILCEMLPFDPKRIQGWCFCWTLLSAAWDVEDGGPVLNNKIEISEILNKFKF